MRSTIQVVDVPYISRDMMSELLDHAEEVWGGFNSAYDHHPEFRALIGSAPGSMGAAQDYETLRKALA
jgi:hypothetical protein